MPEPISVSRIPRPTCHARSTSAPSKLERLANAYRRQLRDELALCQLREEEARAEERRLVRRFIRSRGRLAAVTALTSQEFDRMLTEFKGGLSHDKRTSLSEETSRRAVRWLDETEDRHRYKHESEFLREPSLSTLMTSTSDVEYEQRRKRRPQRWWRPPDSEKRQLRRTRSRQRLLETIPPGWSSDGGSTTATTPKALPASPAPTTDSQFLGGRQLYLIDTTDEESDWSPPRRSYSAGILGRPGASSSSGTETALPPLSARHYDGSSKSTASTAAFRTTGSSRIGSASERAFQLHETVRRRELELRRLVERQQQELRQMTLEQLQEELEENRRKEEERKRDEDRRRKQEERCEVVRQDERIRAREEKKKKEEERIRAHEEKKEEEKERRCYKERRENETRLENEKIINGQNREIEHLIKLEKKKRVENNIREKKDERVRGGEEEENEEDKLCKGKRSCEKQRNQRRAAAVYDKKTPKPPSTPRPSSAVRLTSGERPPTALARPVRVERSAVKHGPAERLRQADRSSNVVGAAKTRPPTGKARRASSTNNAPTTPGYDVSKYVDGSESGGRHPDNVLTLAHPDDSRGTVGDDAASRHRANSRINGSGTFFGRLASKFRNSPKAGGETVLQGDRNDRTTRHADGGDKRMHERVGDGALQTCESCGRSFIKNRILRHQNICQKNTAARRKVFDPRAMRLRGMEQLAYVERMSDNDPRLIKARERKHSWRAKHVELLRTIRVTKGTAALVAPAVAGDYRKCPHCNRTFRSASAETHIPLCIKLGTKPVGK